MTRKVVITAIFLILFSISQQSCETKNRTSPNIIIILTDDQGYNDVGIFGSKDIETPNLDEMASEGVVFSNFHVSEAVSSASRSSLLTGCYASRIGFSGSALGPGSMRALNHNEMTIAELLKQKDYQTAVYGKWHLGDHHDYLPYSQGFDDYFGLPYSNDMWPYDYQGNPASNKKAGYPPLCLIEDSVKTDTIQSLLDQSTLTRRCTDRALQFITENKDKPFFLYLPFNMPHAPVSPSEKFKGVSKYGPYGDVVQEIDSSLGEIRKLLKELDLDENTLVIFMSDNGPWLNFGKYGGCAFPLREGKGTMWEGGSRVPFIVTWPGTIPSGKTCNKLASSIDILPTLAAITQTEPSDNQIDGISILPYFMGDTSQTIRKEFASYYGNELIAVCDNQYKLVFPHTYRNYSEESIHNDGTPGPYHYKTSAKELYDLKSDISEINNILDENPEITSRLEEIADSFRTLLGDRLKGMYGEAVREPGRIGYMPGKHNNLALNKIFQSDKEPNIRYNAGGLKALTDGQLGSMDYTDHKWMGFDTPENIFRLKLDNPIQLNKVRIRFLINQSNWIFGPEEIHLTYKTSDSEKTETIVQNFESGLEDAGPRIQETELPVNKSVKEVSVHIKGTGICPDWHVGKGNPAWLFMDEIILE